MGVKLRRMVSLGLNHHTLALARFIAPFILLRFTVFVANTSHLHLILLLLKIPFVENEKRS